MDNWFKSVWFIRIISLVLAGLLWVTVNLDDTMDSDSLIFNETSSEMAVMNNIPLEVRFDSEEYIVSGLPQEVTVRVEGPASVITPLVRQKNFKVFVDLNGLGPGTHEVSLQHTGISNQLAVSIEPETIEITIEEKTTAEFPVDVDYTNESDLRNDLQLGEAEVNPPKVSVTGAASDIDDVASVKAIIDVGGATESIEDVEAPVKVYDSQGNELNVLVDPTSVTVSVPVMKRSKQVPVQVVPEGEASEGVNVNSVTTEIDQVEIYGPRNVLSEIEELPEIPVDISEVTEDTTIEVDIPLPEGVTKVNPQSIEVMIDAGEPENQPTDEEQTTNDSQ